MPSQNDPATPGKDAVLSKTFVGILAMILPSLIGAILNYFKLESPIPMADLVAWIIQIIGGWYAVRGTLNRANAQPITSVLGIPTGAK